MEKKTITTTLFLSKNIIICLFGGEMHCTPGLKHSSVLDYRDFTTINARVLFPQSAHLFGKKRSWRVVSGAVFFPLFLSRVESVYVSDETEHLVLTLSIIFSSYVLTAT